MPQGNGGAGSGGDGTGRPLERAPGPWRPKPSINTGYKTLSRDSTARATHTLHTHYVFGAPLTRLVGVAWFLRTCLRSQITQGAWCVHGPFVCVSSRARARSRRVCTVTWWVCTSLRVAPGLQRLGGEIGRVLRAPGSRRLPVVGASNASSRAVSRHAARASLVAHPHPTPPLLPVSVQAQAHKMVCGLEEACARHAPRTHPSPPTPTYFHSARANCALATPRLRPPFLRARSP